MASNNRTSTAPAAVLGLEFIELVATDLETVTPFLYQLGFTLTAKHRRKNVYLFQQGTLKVVVNCSDDLSVEAYINELGISVYALALRCHRAADMYHEVIARGGWDKSNHSGPMEINIPGIEGIGGTSIYFIDQIREDLSLYDIDFVQLPEQTPAAAKLEQSLAANFSVESGRKAPLTLWLQRLLNLSEDNQSVELADGFQIRISEDAQDHERCDYVSTWFVKANTALSSTPILPAAAFTVEVE